MDKKTGEQKLDVGVADTKDNIKAGNPVVPIALKLPLDTLAPGTYQVELRAQDSLKNTTDFHGAVFDVE